MSNGEFNSAAQCKLVVGDYEFLETSSGIESNGLKFIIFVGDVGGKALKMRVPMGSIKQADKLTFRFLAPKKEAIHMVENLALL